MKPPEIPQVRRDLRPIRMCPGPKKNQGLKSPQEVEGHLDIVHVLAVGSGNQQFIVSVQIINTIDNLY